MLAGWHVFKQNLKVYIKKEPSIENNPLVSYFWLFELLFLHCFNLKDLNLKKHIERLRKDLLFALQSY